MERQITKLFTIKLPTLLLILITLISITSCANQTDTETVETKLDISDELNKITENIEELDFDNNITKISDELEEETSNIKDEEKLSEQTTEITDDINKDDQEIKPLEKISVPATITEDFKEKLIQKQLQNSNKTFDIITKAGNIIRLILPDKDPNGIDIEYIFQYPFNKDGIFKAEKGEYKTKITAIASNTKVEKEFTVLVT